MNQGQIEKVIDEVTEGIYRDHPSLLTKFGERGRQKCREDNEHHIKQLHSAVTLGDVRFFTDYAVWLNGILTSRGMETKHLTDNFERLEASLLAYAENAEVLEYIKILNGAIKILNAETHA